MKFQMSKNGYREHSTEKAHRLYRAGLAQPEVFLNFLKDNKPPVFNFLKD